MPRLDEEQELALVIDNFKTMNRKVKDELLPPEIAYNCQNMRYDEFLGTIYKRPSRRKYNSATLGTDPITSQIRYYKNSNNTKEYVIATSTFLKTGNDSAGTFTNIKTGLTDNKKFNFITFKDRLYCFNGYDTNQVYDGSNCEDMGVPIPDAPTPALGGGGGLTGTYYYKVTYMIDSYQEGSASTASSVINPSSQQVNVTIPTSANTRVTHRKIYRTKAGGSVYYLVATVSDNTTTTYADNVADNELSTTQAPTDYGAPGIYKNGCLHKSRVFLAWNSSNKSRVIFSDIRSGTAYPDVFPENNYFDIAEDDGDEITGISEDHLGNLVIWKTNSARILYTSGDSPKGWSIGNPFTRFGNIAPYFLIKTPIGVIYMTRFGENKNRFMLWTGIGVKHILEELDPILDAIDPAGIANTVGHFHNGKIYISYTDTSEFPEIAVDSYTKLLLHCDSAAFTDDGNTGHTVTAVGNAQVDTSDYKFASGSLYLPDNTSYLTVPDHANWVFGTNDSAIETWVNVSSFNVGSGQGIISQQESGNDWWCLINLNGGIDWRITVSSTDYSLSTANNVLSVDTWHHIALVRYGNTFTIYIDGVSKKSVTQSITMPDIDRAIWIGRATSSDYNLVGRIDELRVSNGVSRYTENFTPQTQEFGYGYNNKVLVIDAETLQMINVDDKAIDSFSSWNAGTDIGELYSGTSDTSGFCYEEETDDDASESTIEMEYKWGKLNFGQPRLRKRLKSVKIEFTRSVASGTLSYYYSLDGASETQEDIAFATYASQGYYIYHFPFNAYCFHIQPRLYSNSDISSLGIKRVTYVYSLEPYTPLL